MTAAPLPGPVRQTAQPQRAQRVQRPRAELRLVPGVARPPRAPFVLLILALLAFGLLALLMLNTVLAQDAFRLHDLQRRSLVMVDRQQALDQLLARQRTPALLASRAAALGMVPGSAESFIRLADGRVVAVLSPAPGVAPVRPKPSGAPSPAAGAAKPTPPPPPRPPKAVPPPVTATTRATPAKPTPTPTKSPH